MNSNRAFLLVREHETSGIILEQSHLKLLLKTLKVFIKTLIIYESYSLRICLTLTYEISLSRPPSDELWTRLHETKLLPDFYILFLLQEERALQVYKLDTLMFQYREKVPGNKISRSKFRIFQ